MPEPNSCAAFALRFVSVLRRQTLFMMGAIALAGCSGSGSPASDATGLVASNKPKSTANDKALCHQVARLDTAASVLKQADSKDPDAFKKTLDGAVKEYVAAIDTIKKSTPADIDVALDIVKAETLAHRFVTAKAAREPLDTWYINHC